MSRRYLSPILIAFCLNAAACGGSNAEESSLTTAVPVATTAAPATTAVATTTSVAVSDDPAREHLDWLVSVLNDGAQLTQGDTEQRFHPEFLAEIPYEQLAMLLPQVLAAAKAPYEVESYETTEISDTEEDGTSIEIVEVDAVIVGADGGRLAPLLYVEANPPNQIVGLSITPVVSESIVPESIDDIDAQLADLGPQSSLGLYDLTSGECEAVHEIRADTPIVLASVFKLWVLAALAHEINEGRATWTETMVLTDELRSNPVGEIYALETGTEVSLEHLADAMIAISDNTATDMLISRLGRPLVEATMERAGVADPSANVPFLMTRNLFALKYMADPPNTADYLALDEAGKRAMLAEMDQTVLPWVAVSIDEVEESTNIDGLTIEQPRDLDVEWFATSSDLCRTFLHLSELAETPGLEPVVEILKANDAGLVEYNRDPWSSIRFKGGNEAGVVAGAWWFEGTDGARYVVAGGVSNPDAAVPVAQALPLLVSAIELID